MKSAPTVAVVILNWNGRKYLEQFLPSLIANTQTEACRIIVADNASTDDSLAFLAQNYPTVETIVFDKNYGFTGGYNRALARIDANYYVILNSDIEVAPDWLTPIISFMEERPQVAAVQPKILSYHNKTMFEYAGAAGGFLDYLGYPFCRGRMLDIVEEDKGQHDVPMQIFWATGACMIVRSEDFLEAGGFAEDFFAHMEEIDLCWRFQKMGSEIWCLPFSKVYHVGGGTLPNKHPFKIYLNHRNSLFMLFRNLPYLHLLPLILTRLVLDGLSAVLYIFQGHPKFLFSVIKSHFAFYFSLPKLLWQRKHIREQSLLNNAPAMVHKSLLWAYFVKKKRSFNSFYPQR